MTFAAGVLRSGQGVLTLNAAPSVVGLGSWYLGWYGIGTCMQIATGSSGIGRLLVSRVVIARAACAVEGELSARGSFSLCQEVSRE